MDRKPDAPVRALLRRTLNLNDKGPEIIRAFFLSA